METNEKKRSSVTENTGRSDTTSSAKKRLSLTVENGGMDIASTGNRRSSVTVETGQMETMSTDSEALPQKVETGKTETVSCDATNSPPSAETTFVYGRQFSVPVSSGPSETTYREKKRSSVTFETVKYEVQQHDTLLSIGARFGMAPSEIKQLNKLMINHVYTGQKLLIYTKNFFEAEEREKDQKLADEQRERAEKQAAEEQYRAIFDLVPLEPSAFDAPRSRHSSIAASDQLRLRNPSGRVDDMSDGVLEKSVDTIIRNIKKNRLRLEAKYVTDGQGVVSGTLLVTTNTIMFDPNVSDRLVMDRGPTPYVMVAPFEFVVRLAIVEDIAAMKWQRDSKTPPPRIYQACDSSRYETIAEIPISNRDELVSSVESSSCSQKCDSAVVTNGTCSSSTDSKEVSEDENASGDLMKIEKAAACFSNGLKCEETVHTENLVGTVEPQPDEVDDYVNSDTYSNNANQVLIKNRMNLGDMPLENSPRPGLYAQKRLSHASYGLFPIDDIDPVSDHCFPSSLNSLIELTSANQARNSPALFGSPRMHTNSYKTSPFDIGPALPIGRRQSSSNLVEIKASSLGHRQNLSNMVEFNASSFGRGPSFSNMVEFNASSFKRGPSFSNMIESNTESPSKLIPVYSAKSVQSVVSGMNAGDSFYIPPGQNFIIDLSWEQFGELKEEDGWCTSVRDLPPILDEDAQQMEKPDFYISDDDDDVTQAEPLETLTNAKEKSSEVDVVKLLRSTKEIYKSLDVLIPRPATHYEDLPWYLCVVIGYPMPSKAGKMSSTEPYSTEDLKPAYWFSVHRHDVDPLYEFIMTHFSNIYGSEDKVNPADRGLMVLSQELLNSKLEASSSTCQFFLTESEYLHLPELSEESKILDDNQLAKLNSELFPRAKDNRWKLVYSIERDGTSLQTLYRKMNDMAESDPPCVIVVRDSSRTVFGAVMSCTVKRSKEYFGNGESFLFSFRDGFKKYSASYVNEYYGYGYRDSLCFGAHHGKCGLWLDGDLHHGRTQECATYHNDILTVAEDFYVHQLEAWCLI